MSPSKLCVSRDSIAEYKLGEQKNKILTINRLKRRTRVFVSKNGGEYRKWEMRPPKGCHGEEPLYLSTEPSPLTVATISKIPAALFAAELRHVLSLHYSFSIFWEWGSWPLTIEYFPSIS